jgi:fatty acid desaturase
MKNPFTSRKINQIIVQKIFITLVLLFLIGFLFINTGIFSLLFAPILLILNRIGAWIGHLIFHKNFKKIEIIDLLIFSLSMLSLGFYYFEVYKLTLKLSSLISSVFFWIASVCFIVALNYKRNSRSDEK